MLTHAIVPRTLDDVQLHYRAYIRSAIGSCARSRGRALQGADIEDLYQQVLLKIFRLHLLERYDPAKAKFSTYLSLIVRGVVSYAFDPHRGAKDPVVRAYEYARGPEGGLYVGERQRQREALRDVIGILQRGEVERALLATCLCDEFQAYLNRLPATRVPQIRRATRCAQVFGCLREGLTAVSTAARLQTTPRQISRDVAYLKHAAIEFLARPCPVSLSAAV